MGGSVRKRVGEWTRCSGIVGEKVECGWESW